MSIILGYLFIFVARCTDVTLATIRTIFVIKGRRKIAFIIAIFEIVIYLSAMSKVLGDMSDPIKVGVYALGFATGNVIGITLESKLAIGLISAQVFTDKCVDEFSNYLRSYGFGVTVIEGKGKEGTKYILQVALDRKYVGKFEKIVTEYDENAFLTISEIRSVKGGYFEKNGVRSVMK